MTGGLGNQMFIYAFYLQMQKKFPDVQLDLSDIVHYKVHNGYEMNSIFNLPKKEFRINQTLKKVIEFLFFKTIIERKQKDPLNIPNKRFFYPFIYFKGFYQSEKYFENIKDEVRMKFAFNLNLLNPRSKSMIHQIDADEHAVSLHIRRGDYLLPQHWKTIGCICQLPYYKNAISFIEKNIKEPTFYIYSDDINWVKQNISPNKVVYIDWNKEGESWQDMALMSHCRHHIICNSTFSWWGAWLNPSKEKIVVAPEQWFRHIETPYIYPKEWIKIPIN